MAMKSALWKRGQVVQCANDLAQRGNVSFCMKTLSGLCGLDTINYTPAKKFPETKNTQEQSPLSHKEQQENCSQL